MLYVIAAVLSIAGTVLGAPQFNYPAAKPYFAQTAANQYFFSQPSADYQPVIQHSPVVQSAPVQPFAVPTSKAQNYGPAIPTTPKPIGIVSQTQEVNPDGTFSYGFVSENGISSQSSGYIKNPGTENEIQVIEGYYSYYDVNGNLITIKYIADEQGFRAEGPSIPTTPSAPVARGNPPQIRYFKRSHPHDGLKP